MTVLNREDGLVQFKLGALERLLPARSGVVFGDMWRVDGGYTLELADRGVPRVVLVDTLETPSWLEERLKRPNVDFYKGDFADALFMRSIRDRFEVSVVFDILLHQPPLLHTINLMLRLTESRIAIVQPMLRELEVPNGLVYLPGNTQSDLYPLAERHSDYNAFDVHQVNHAFWQWGMTRSFLASVLAGEGFSLTWEEELAPLPNPRWYWWGCVAERTSETPASHWSRTIPPRGLHTLPWD